MGKTLWMASGSSSSAIWEKGSWNFGVAVGFTAMAGIALAATLLVSSRGHKSPWSTVRRKLPLTLFQWNNLLTPDGKLRDKVKFLKKVRSGGVDPSIRHIVWPFLLGVYNLNSSKDERNETMAQKRNEYTSLRRKCHELSKPINGKDKRVEDLDAIRNEDRPDEPDSVVTDVDVSVSNSSTVAEGLSDFHNVTLDNATDSSTSAIQVDGNVHVINGDASEVESSERSHSDHSDKPPFGVPNDSSSCNFEQESSGITDVNLSEVDIQVSTSKISEEETESTQNSFHEETEPQPAGSSQQNIRQADFHKWQHIIRLDAIRASGDWISYSPSQAAVSSEKACQFAEEVGLKDYDDLEPCRIYHAARLVAILDAYAVYDPETGYCQGMSDLLSPILAVMEEDDEAFWCFVGFMRKARHNFRLDEAGIKRQLNMISKIIKSRDPRLYRHLEKLQAEGCFFVYRMVLVMFRRELTFEQTLCLWEVMWSDQAATRAGIGKSGWTRIRMRAPPTDDLLLYAVAAAVLQKHKVIIEKYTSMYDIMRELHDMAGQIDVWKLLDDAHDLVAKVHSRIT